MFSNILAQHVPYIPGFGSETAGPVPSPPPSPAPPQDEPIAFSAVVRDSLFGIVSSAISSTTLATITCADASMTITTSQTVAGLTFSYSGNVLSVSGTPTASGFTRVVVSYISSDGNRTVRGSTSHEISIVDATEVVTIDTTYPVPQGRKGFPYETTICDLSANYSASIRASVVGVMTGLSVSLTWERGVSSGSGGLEVSGIPASSGTGSFSAFFVDNETGQTKAAIAFQVVVQPSYTAVSPAPPAPPAPSPTPIAPPPAPTPAPAPGAGPDPYFAQVKVLMHFDSATGIATDVKGNTFTNTGATLATGAVGEAANFSSASTKMEGRIAGIDGADGTLTVEAVVNLSAAGWTAMTGGSLTDVRFCPVATLIDDDDNVVWSLGFMSSRNLTGPAGRYVVGAFYNGLTGFQFGNPAGSNSASSYAYQELASNPGRFLHLCGCRRRNPVSPTDGDYDQGTWLDGKGGGVRIVPSLSLLRTAATGTLRIGGVTPAMEYANANVGVRRVTLIPFSGQIDELRITTFARHSALMVNQQVLAIDPYRRVIPWPNY